MGVADDLRVSDRIVIPGGDLRERFSRSSGPGGQGVNTADSRVELSVDLGATTGLPEDVRAQVLDRLARRLVDGVLTIAASEYRQQLANREAARDRLADILREALAPPPKPRRATRPSRAAKQRRLDEKKRRSQRKRERGRVDGD
jgi:ribosome-associated protein